MIGFTVMSEKFILFLGMYKTFKEIFALLMHIISKLQEPNKTSTNDTLLLVSK